MSYTKCLQEEMSSCVLNKEGERSIHLLYRHGERSRLHKNKDRQSIYIKKKEANAGNELRM
jgi:hypothetical protein